MILKWTDEGKKSKLSASEWIENQGRDKVRHFSAALSSSGALRDFSSRSD